MFEATTQTISIITQAQKRILVLWVAINTEPPFDEHTFSRVVNIKWLYTKARNVIEDMDMSSHLLCLLKPLRCMCINNVTLNFRKERRRKNEMRFHHAIAIKILVGSVFFW